MKASSVYHKIKSFPLAISQFCTGELDLFSGCLVSSIIFPFCGYTFLLSPRSYRVNMLHCSINIMSLLLLLSSRHLSVVLEGLDTQRKLEKAEAKQERRRKRKAKAEADLAKQKKAKLEGAAKSQKT